MKKKSVFAALLALVTIGTASSVMAYDGNDRLPVEANYAASITVDGVKDDGYGPLYTVEQEGVAHTVGLDLTTGQVALAWNETHMYFYCEVYDQNTPYAVSTTDWQCDGPEFFLDLMNNKAASYDETCFRVRVIAAYDKEGSVWGDQILTFNGHGSDQTAVNSAAVEDFEVAIVPLNGTDWADGYAVELSYEYSKYIEPLTNGYKMGWDVQICDDVIGLGNRDSQAFLGNPADVAHNNPAGFGSEITFVGASAAETPETEAPETEAPETEALETEAPETEAPETETEVVTPAETAETASETVETTAPQTFDAGIMAAAAAMVSAAGYAISKKRR